VVDHTKPTALEPEGENQTALLVKDQDGLPVWRTVRAKVLVGWEDRKGAITSGHWAKTESVMLGSAWAVLQTAKGKKLLAYRFDDYNPKEPDALKTGVLHVCDSWRELESTAPANIFEEALLQAGIKKPSEYREAPLEL
jgi:hypothetical protein